MASQRRARIVRGLGVMVVFCLSTTANLSAQGGADSVRRVRSDTASQRLIPVRVQAPAIPGTVRAASRITAGMLTTGAKSEVVNVAGMSANLSEKSGRQISAEVPGVFVYDMDGSGNQVNISTRCEAVLEVWLTQRTVMSSRRREPPPGRAHWSR